MFAAVLFDMFETLVTHTSMPPYFGLQMAEDAGIAPEMFLPLWWATEDDRTLGRLTVTQGLTQALTACGCYTPEMSQLLAGKFFGTTAACFERLHPGILPMLSALRARGLRLGLISNCYHEEAAVIRSSTLFPYFDAAFLSCEKAMKKPDAAYSPTAPRPWGSSARNASISATAAATSLPQLKACPCTPRKPCGTSPQKRSFPPIPACAPRRKPSSLPLRPHDEEIFNQL